MLINPTHQDKIVIIQQDTRVGDLLKALKKLKGYKHYKIQVIIPNEETNEVAQSVHHVGDTSAHYVDDEVDLPIGNLPSSKIGFKI